MNEMKLTYEDLQEIYEGIVSAREETDENFNEFDEFNEDIEDNDDGFPGFSGLDDLYTDVCESKVYRTRRSLGNHTRRDTCDLVFLYCLALAMLTSDYRYAGPASKYAKRTMQFPSFQGFRGSGTDLYIAFAASRPDHHLQSRLKFLSTTVDAQFQGQTVNVIAFKRFLRMIMTMDNDRTFFKQYLYKLEGQMKISDSRYKSWRRMIGSWDQLNHNQRMLTAVGVFQEIRRRWPMGEIVPFIREFSKLKTIVAHEKGQLGAFGAGLGAGALAGGMAGGGNKFGKGSFGRDYIAKPAAAGFLGWNFAKLGGK